MSSERKPWEIPPQLIVRNAARCLGCGKVIESYHRHNFVSHRCLSDGVVHDFFVDGGREYLRRGWDSGDTGKRHEAVYEEASVTIQAPYAAMGVPTYGPDLSTLVW